MTYTTPVVSSSKKMNNVNKGLVIQEPVELAISDDFKVHVSEMLVVEALETTKPHIKEVPVVKAPERSQRIRKLAISDDYKVYVSEIQIEGDPTSFEEAMRSAHSPKMK
jgi:hypothetical protein